MRKASRSSAKTHPSLARYQDKRDFTQTAEPSSGVSVVGSKRGRFVVQKHAASHLHYDLRLEIHGVFKSWAVTKGPSIDPGDKRLAVEVEDHPLDYGDFEGTIPKGQYGGGTVQLWDRGYWAPIGVTSAEDGLKSGELKFTLEGERLQGSWVLVRMKNDRYGGKRINWLLIKHRDQFARPGAAQALLDLDRSVASGRSMAQIAKGTGKAPKTGIARNAGKSATAAPQRSMPTFIEPQLCQLVDRPPVAGSDVLVFDDDVQLSFVDEDHALLDFGDADAHGGFLTRK